VVTARASRYGPACLPAALYLWAPPGPAAHARQAHRRGLLLGELPRRQVRLPALLEVLREVELTRGLPACGGPGCAQQGGFTPCCVWFEQRPGARPAPRASGLPSSACRCLLMRALRAAIRWSLAGQQSCERSEGQRIMLCACTSPRACSDRAPCVPSSSSMPDAWLRSEAVRESGLEARLPGGSSAVRECRTELDALQATPPTVGRPTARLDNLKTDSSIAFWHSTSRAHAVRCCKKRPGFTRLVRTQVQRDF